MTNDNDRKLKEIDHAIRGHYFRNGCSHKQIVFCKAFILDEIIKIVNYKPRYEMTLQKEGNTK